MIVEDSVVAFVKEPAGWDTAGCAAYLSLIVHLVDDVINIFPLAVQSIDNASEVRNWQSLAAVMLTYCA